jgi:hypothetical protein
MPVRGSEPQEPVFRVVRRSFHGAQVRYRVAANGVTLEVVAPSTSVLAIGAEVVVHARARQVPVYLGQRDDPSAADSPELASSS